MLLETVLNGAGRGELPLRLITAADGTANLIMTIANTSIHSVHDDGPLVIVEGGAVVGRHRRGRWLGRLLLSLMSQSTTSSPFSSFSRRAGHQSSVVAAAAAVVVT